MNENRWSPRFSAYARAHGRSETAQLEHDTEEYPGGKMVGFILWINARWREWQLTVGRKDLEAIDDREQAHFTAWLAERCP